MATLIHLNGPPGIGKSTLASLWVDRHPGSLDLDLDRLLGFVGGWRDPDLDVHQVLRPLALTMAGTHLAGGRDVVLPQYLATDAEIDAFATVAREQDARFVEVVLLDTREEALARFDRRPDDTPWAAHHRRHVDLGGGEDLLAAMYDRLRAVATARRTTVVECRTDAVEETYARLREVVGA